LEENSNPHRTSGPLSFGHEEIAFQKGSTLLGDTKMFGGDKAKLPGLGISRRTSLLVYQWDNLFWREPGKLAEKDENMPTMRCVPSHVSSSAHYARRTDIKMTQ
jgi:hypothetical protein